MSKRKLRLRPWVKIAMLFVIGVIVTTKIFSLFGASASTEVPESNIYYGVVQLNLNGESELSMLSGDFKENTKVKHKQGYDLGQVVAIVIQGNRVVRDYICTGSELKNVEKEYSYDIDTVRRNILQAEYKK